MKWAKRMKKDRRMKRAGFPRREKRPKPRCVRKRRAWELLELGEVQWE